MSVAKNLNEELEKLGITEELELTKELAKKLFDEEDVDYYEEDLDSREIKTMYDTYKGFGDYSHMVIKAEDFKRFVEDTCKEFAQCLPDKFDEYFNTSKLEEDIWEWPVCLRQAQEFIDNAGGHVDYIKKWIPTNTDCYIIEL